MRDKAVSTVIIILCMILCMTPICGILFHKIMIKTYSSRFLKPVPTFSDTYNKTNKKEILGDLIEICDFLSSRGRRKYIYTSAMNLPLFDEDIKLFMDKGYTIDKNGDSTYIITW